MKRHALRKSLLCPALSFWVGLCLGASQEGFVCSTHAKYSWSIGQHVAEPDHHDAGAGGIGDNGEARWEYFRHVVAVPSIKKTGGALSFSNFKNGQLWLALITFLYGALSLLLLHCTLATFLK